MKTGRTIKPGEFDILQLHPIPTWVIDAENFSVLFSNKAASEKYGVHEHKEFLDYLSEESRVRFFYAVSKDLSSLKGIYTVTGSHKKEVTTELYASRFQFKDKWCYQVSCVDLTSRISEGQVMEEESRRYKTYFDQSTDGIYCQEFSVPLNCSGSFEYMIDHTKQFSYIAECNHAMARMYGFERPEELKGVLSEALIDFDAPSNYEFFKAFISNGFRITNAQSQEKDRFGNNKYFLNNAFGVIENGYLIRIWGTQQDITEKKNTENKLQLLANLVEQTSDILTAADINYIPITWNKAAENIYGVTAEQVIGKPITDFIKLEYTNTNRDAIRKIVKEEGGWTGEASFTRPTDKRIITLVMSFKMMMDENGEHLGFLVSANDITDRKEVECKLKESENRFREVADSSPVMIWMCNEHNQVTYCNKTWFEYTQRQVSDLQSWTSIVHKDDLDKVLSEFNKAFASRKHVTLFYRLLNKDGNYCWVQDTSVPRFSGEKFMGYIGSAVDIQRQKQKELQLRYNAIILENVSDVIITTGLDFKVISMNASAEFYYGILEEEAQGNIISDMLNFDFIGTSLEQVILRLQNFGIWKGEVSVVNRDGDKKYFLHSLKEIRDDNNIKIGYMAVGKDITEMKVAQEQMKGSELFYRTLIADSLDGMILLNAEGNITFASPSVKNVLGYEVEDVQGRNGFEFVHPDDLLWAAQSFEKEVVENPEVKFIVVRLKKRSGDWVWCMVRGHNMLRNPHINSIVIYFHDDSLRKKASDALKESEKRFRNLIRDMQIGVLLSDQKGKIMLCNNALSKMLNIPEEEITGRNVYDFISDDMIDENERPVVKELRPMTKAIRTKKPVRDFVIGMIHPVTNQKSWIMLNSDPVLNDAGEITHLVTSIMDITERKKLERKLISEKISHQRQLTQATLDGQEAERREIGKELHDNIGQQLTTIKLFLDLAKSTADDATNEMVSMALKGVGDVINGIRAMSRSLVPSTLQDLGLIESINEMVDSICRTQVMDIVVEHSDFDEELLPENQKLTIFRIIQEQLNNIVKHSGAQNVLISLISNKNEILLNINDDGNGFDPKKIKKGLGFINIANRAELFGGKQQVITSPGKGCTLKVNFPLPSMNAGSSLSISLT